MSRFSRYIKRGVKYILYGQPVVDNKVVANIVTIAPNDLLKGRTALITGGTSGIGKAIAEAFVNAGASVIITSRSNERVQVAVSELTKNSKGKVFGFVMDCTNISQIMTTWKQILEEVRNPIDILVNNAGIIMNQVTGTQEEIFDKIMDTNLKGTYFLSKIVAKYMIAEHIHGNILMICSSSSLRPAISPYTLSKWGVRALTLGLAKSLSPYDIVVNGLAPGPTISGMTEKTEENLYKTDSPIRRWALPVEIANMAVMLVSDVCRTVIGDVLYMTGGAGLLTNEDMSYNLQ